MNQWEALGLTPEKGNLTPAQIGAVKGLGCLRDKRYDDIFNVRVITRNGKITAEELCAIATASKKFGSGEVAFTIRQTAEIQGVAYDNIPALIFYLKEQGLETGGTGAKVRPVVSCKGTTCVFGLIDTFGLSREIHDKFYLGYHQVALPHKFKIAVGGCPNNCVKPDTNDIGVMGQALYTLHTENCRGCKACLSACPMKAMKVEKGKLEIDENLCNHCGRCLEKCPFGVFEKTGEGYKIFLGGRWGKKAQRGTPLSRIFTSEDEVLNTIEKAILYFKEQGEQGERFADTIARLGFDHVEKALL